MYQPHNTPNTATVTPMNANSFPTRAFPQGKSSSTAATNPGALHKEEPG